jgi:hypothetical protein
MALNWNIEKCKNYKQLTEGSESVTTDVMIWATMIVGIGTITKANYKEFYARLHLVELISGTLITEKGKPHYLTLSDVERRIGLTTNVGNTSRPQFIKAKVNRYFQEQTA